MNVLKYNYTKVKPTQYKTMIQWVIWYIYSIRQRIMKAWLFEHELVLPLLSDNIDILSLWSCMIKEIRCYEAKTEKMKGPAVRRQESNQDIHLLLEPPVLCHWATTVRQPPTLTILYCMFWRHILSGCQLCDWGIQYHLCSKYRELWGLVVVQLSWLTGRALVAQARDVLGSTPSDCHYFSIK